LNISLGLINQATAGKESYSGAVLMNLEGLMNLKQGLNTKGKYETKKIL
jgi:hypothetical protein